MTTTKEDLIYACLVEIRDYLQRIAEAIPKREDIHFCGHGFIATTCKYCADRDRDR